jgi:hypothetical protein
MESYLDKYHIRNFWQDGLMTGTNNSIVVMGKYSSNASYLPHGGDQIMRYLYNNFDAPLYSEAYLPLPPHLRDWEQEGVRAFTLFFYGLPHTELYMPQDQLYLGIEDANGLYAEVRYGDYERAAEEDINDINKPEWHEWFIALPDFNDPCYAAAPNDVYLRDVNKLYIGFGDRWNPGLGGLGEVRFDDIRLNLPTCVYEITKPVADFTGRRGVPDCVVDWWDIGYFAENEWLKSDANYVDVATEPCDANLIGHWALDGDPCDSSSYDHNSTIWGKYEWATGHNYDISPTDGAVKFTGTGRSRGGRIRVDDSNILKPKYAVTASAWVYFTKSQGDGRVVVKGGNDKETYAIEVDDTDQFKFYVRDPCEKQWDVGDNRETLYPGEWVHLAGTYDGDSNTVKGYVNARLIESRKDANFVEGGLTLSQDTNDLAIGARSDTTTAAKGDPFIGSIDEVRIYNYALDPNEIKWLATDGTGYRRLRSKANFYDLEPENEKAVNFRDLAVMIEEHWLEVIKWP